MDSDSEKRLELKDLEEILQGRGQALGEFLLEVHPADLAEWIQDLEPAQIARVMGAQNAEQRSELLSFADDSLSTELLEYLSVEQIVQVIEELPVDEAVDLLALTDEARSERVLRSVDFERAQGLRELASYGPDTVGGLMTTEFFTVLEDAHVGDAIKDIKSEEGPASEEELGVFIVDGEGRPTGYVSDRDLLTTPIHTPIKDVMETDLITIAATEDQEEVGQLVRKYSFSAVPVVDEDGVLIGVVSGEDAEDVFQEEAEEDILRIVGTSPEEQQTRLPVLVRVRHRLPLQALTVIGGLVTAWILDLALPDGEAGGTVDILRYLPIIIGLAGNVGIQSSTILVRAFATGEVSPEREKSVLGSEVLVGTLIGLICGVTTMGVASLIESSEPNALAFGVAVGGAISVAVTWASFLGCVVPIVCRRMGIDPAIVAGPFLITLSDISGAAIFIGVATLTLGIGS
jgi:magnesium transporter